jgi:two-component system, OmpR family, response regulator
MMQPAGPSGSPVKMRVLVIEDEKQIAEVVAAGLRNEKIEVELCHTGTEGLRVARSGIYDAVVLDIMLPDVDGLEILQRLRLAGNDVPVILLTARDSVQSRVQGLQHGADDYVTKPFYIEELVARVHAVTRRQADRSGEHLVLGPLIVNCTTRDVFVGRTRLILTSREFALLSLLMRAPGHVFTRSAILEEIWEITFDPNNNIVDVYIRRLREKISDAGLTNVIDTVRGVGYSITLKSDDR